jgi:antitoxin PrlF
MAKTAEILEIPATITERGQTTVPAAIRKMLALGKRDQVVFRGLADGTVVIAKKVSRAEDGDPVIGKFLEFLARDMAKEPGRIRPVPSSLVSRGRDLVKGVKVDLDAPLPDDEA